ncbi:MAG: SPOR domain-containing protein [Balneolaceae bacterium]|nr:SPOR domain-containing protein [Balneolaceae bacterium]
MTSPFFCGLIFFILLCPDASAQEEPGRLSIGLLGGVTYGNLNSAGQSFFDGRSSIELEKDIYFSGGINLRYALSPLAAIQANVVAGNLSFSGYSEVPHDLLFDNRYLATFLSGQVNLLRLLGGTSDSFQVFGSAGSGFLFNNADVHRLDQAEGWVNVPEAELKNQAIVNSLGTGVRMNAIRKIDFFLQYDYYLSTSDLVDGYAVAEFTGSDRYISTSNRWSAFSFGFQIKLGGNLPDADWYHSPAPTAQPPLRLAAAPAPEISADNYSDEIAHLTSKIELITSEMEQLRANADSLQTAPPPAPVQVRETESGVTTVQLQVLRDEISEIRGSMEQSYGLYGNAITFANDGYTIIVHSLSNYELAENAAENLESQGYRALLLPVTIDGVRYTRVGLGQFRTQAEARSAGMSLTALFGDDYFIQPIR